MAERWAVGRGFTWNRTKKKTMGMGTKTWHQPLFRLKKRSDSLKFLVVSFCRSTLKSSNLNCFQSVRQRAMRRNKTLEATASRQNQLTEKGHLQLLNSHIYLERLQSEPLFLLLLLGDHRNQHPQLENKQSYGCGRSRKPLLAYQWLCQHGWCSVSYLQVVEYGSIKLCM